MAKKGRRWRSFAPSTDCDSALGEFARQSKGKSNQTRTICRYEGRTATDCQRKYKPRRLRPWECGSVLMRVSGSIFPRAVFLGGGTRAFPLKTETRPVARVALNPSPPFPSPLPSSLRSLQVAPLATDRSRGRGFVISASYYAEFGSARAFSYGLLSTIQVPLPRSRGPCAEEKPPAVPRPLHRREARL
jgi:hypothetical protein